MRDYYDRLNLTAFQLNSMTKDQLINLIIEREDKSIAFQMQLEDYKERYIREKTKLEFNLNNIKLNNQDRNSVGWWVNKYYGKCEQINNIRSVLKDEFARMEKKGIKLNKSFIKRLSLDVKFNTLRK